MQCVHVGKLADEPASFASCACSICMWSSLLQGLGKSHLPVVRPSEVASNVATTEARLHSMSPASKVTSSMSLRLWVRELRSTSLIMRVSQLSGRGGGGGVGEAPFFGGSEGGCLILVDGFFRQMRWVCSFMAPGNA